MSALKAGVGSIIIAQKFNTTKDIDAVQLIEEVMRAGTMTEMPMASDIHCTHAFTEWSLAKVILSMNWGVSVKMEGFICRQACRRIFL